MHPKPPQDEADSEEFTTGAVRKMANDAPSKAIRPALDRLQSRVLVAAVSPVLLWIGWQAIQFGRSAGHTVYLMEALAVSLIFGLAAFRLRAATPAAAALGSLICFDLTVFTGMPDSGFIAHSGLTPLLLLFVFTYAATRFRRDRTSSAHEEEEARRGRNAAQVIANLGIAAYASLWWYSIIPSPPHHESSLYAFAVAQTPMLAALAEATADTVSSEIGRAIGGRPFLLTAFRRVAPGTDGAVSIVGTLAGIAAAAAIALIGMAALGIKSAYFMRVLLAAIAGLFFDSLLGATLERKGWIGNDAVNFASTTFAAALCSTFVSLQVA